MRVLHLDEIEIFLPVRPLFLERRRAVAHLDPLDRAVAQAARAFHVAQIFAAGNRTGAERAVFDGIGERLLASCFHPSCHQIAHILILSLQPR